MLEEDKMAPTYSRDPAQDLAQDLTRSHPIQDGDIRAIWEEEPAKDIPQHPCVLLQHSLGTTVLMDYIIDPSSPGYLHLWPAGSLWGPKPEGDLHPPLLIH